MKLLFILQIITASIIILPLVYAGDSATLEKGTHIIVESDEINSSQQLDITFENRKNEQLILKNKTQNISLQQPFQKFQDSFTIKKIITSNNKSLLTNPKKIRFEELNIYELSPQIEIKNISINNSTITYSINYSNAYSYEIITNRIESSEGKILSEKIFPIKPGKNNLTHKITSNISKLYVYIDTTYELPLYTRENTIKGFDLNDTQQCQGIQEFNGIQIFDFDCGNTCPQILSSIEKWVLLECYQNQPWKITIYDTLPKKITPTNNGSIKLFSNLSSTILVKTKNPIKLSNDALYCYGKNSSINLETNQPLSFQVKKDSQIILNTKE